MAQWLVIALRGPFASFSDAPGNTTRKTAAMPTRSALIGLAGAALGIRREDEPGQRALSAGLVTAAAMLRSGAHLQDFHTFQSLHQAAKGARSRAEALTKMAHVETAITRREYRTDGLWQAAYRLSSKAAGTLALDVLAQAFRTPHFALYIGRRSCPPSHPLNPQLFDVDDVRQAFSAHAQATGALSGHSWQEISLEDARDVTGPNTLSDHRRSDDPRDRTIRWTFAERTEWRLAAHPDGKSPR